MTRSRPRGLPVTVGPALAAWLAARGTLALLDAADRRRTPGRGAAAPADDRWHRRNHAGAPVTLYAGPAALAGLAAGLGAAAVGGLAPRTVAAAGLGAAGAAAVGWYDDARTVTPVEAATKGFAGHLGALGSGRVSAGIVKLAGIGVAALAASAVAEGTVPGAVLAAGVVAGSAGVANLLDLRPGRAAKAVGAAVLPLALRGGAGAPLAAATLGATAAVLRADLAGRTMLGDTGAGALGALCGAAAAATLRPAGRLAWFAAVAGLTAASERVSFTAVIERQPMLRRLDRLGRPSRP